MVDDRYDMIRRQEMSGERYCRVVDGWLEIRVNIREIGCETLTDWVRFIDIDIPRRGLVPFGINKDWDGDGSEVVSRFTYPVTTA